MALKKERLNTSDYNNVKRNYALLPLAASQLRDL